MDEIESINNDFSNQKEVTSKVASPKVASPKTLNLPKLYEDVNKNNAMFKKAGKSQRDLNLKFMQFWPVSKNFKIASKKLSEDEQQENVQPALFGVDELKSQKSNDVKGEKRPITGASSNINKYEIDFNDYNNYKNSNKE